MTTHETVEFVITWLITIVIVGAFAGTLTHDPAERRFLRKMNIGIATAVFALLYASMWYFTLGVK